MKRSTKILAGVAVAAAVAAGGAGIATAGGSDDAGEGPDTPITGADLDRAEQAALAETGGGRSPARRSATRRATTRSR